MQARYVTQATQAHVVFLLNSPWWLVICARLGVNLPSWFAIPMKRRTSGTVVDGFISLMANTFSGSAQKPFWPINLMDILAIKLEFPLH